MRALLSVYDKTGLIDFARALNAAGYALVSTGGTQAAIADAGIPARHVEDITGFPEILDGRVKSLHPAIYGGILARRDIPEHNAQLATHDIGAIARSGIEPVSFRGDRQPPGRHPYRRAGKHRHWRTYDDSRRGKELSACHRRG